MRKLLSLLFASAIVMNSSQAQETPHTPPTGSAERTAILEAARKPAVEDLGKPVEFVVKQIDVLDQWAFLHARMQSPGGQTIDYAGTKYADAAQRGQKSASYAALLQRSGNGWSVVAFSIGPTDVAWVGWAQEYSAPAVLFEPADTASH
jgi:hypothetical protein